MKNTLEDPEPKKLFPPLPLLYVTAINKRKTPETDKLSNFYPCPVYKYPKKTDKYWIFNVNLPCD